METKIKYETKKSNLIKSDDEWRLYFNLDEEVYINLSDKNQERLKDVFNVLIKQMILSPFKIQFESSNESEAKGLNEICEKYIEILNNDLKGVYEDYLKEIENFKDK